MDTSCVEPRYNEAFGIFFIRYIAVPLDRVQRYMGVEKFGLLN